MKLFKEGMMGVLERSRRCCPAPGSFPVRRSVISCGGWFGFGGVFAA
jgi:hypothetical protein